MSRNNNMNFLENKNLNSEEFYQNFKVSLEKEHNFPGNYMFKFIVPSTTKKIAELHKIFDHASASFAIKESSQGKYTSITVNVYIVNATSVIEYYKEASAIEEIVML